MCLLIMLAQTHPDFPLIVAANRDELLDRPAVPMTVLRETGPRVLGGRDELAGGTWLAVNDAGVVAGITNRPTSAGRDPSKRSRGELPIALGRHTSAAAAVEAFGSTVRSSDYNSACLLVGDRDSVFAIDITGHDSPVIRPLPPGIHILENRPVGTESPKANHVSQLLAGGDRLPDGPLVRRLQAVLSDHELPPGPSAVDEAGIEAPPQVNAACVHTERYGTRWSSVIMVPGDPAHPPTVRYADGPPCRVRYRDASSLWCHTQREGTTPRH
ncbi:MAG: NRDE family protein [Acidimicrobiia bacterium]